MASRAHVITPCDCGSNAIDSDLKYLDDDDGLLGVFCLECGGEWLEKAYLPSSNGDDFTRFYGNVQLLKNRRQTTTRDFKVQYNRTKVKNVRYAVYMLKAGDHIQFEGKFYDHHAIVERVNPRANSIFIIEYKKVGVFELIVKRDVITFNTANIRNLYRIDYDKNMADSCNLIIARARAWLGQARYNLFTRNCESFSVYCVVGAFVSWQAINFFRKVTRCIQTTVTKTCFKTAVEVGVGEIIESTTAGAAMSNLAGASIVIVTEGICVVMDVKELYSKRQQGGLTLKDFLKNTIERIFAGLTTAGLVVAGSIAGEFAGGALGTLICPGLGTMIGMFIGSIIGGVVAAVPGNLCGSFMGRQLGKAIAATVKTDDEEVNFPDIKEGDQIVMSAWFLHPRCHAIVTHVDREQSTLKVIRNTYENGVIEEVLDFVPPVYRVIYPAKDRYTVQRSIERARSKIENSERLSGLIDIKKYIFAKPYIPPYYQDVIVRSSDTRNLEFCENIHMAFNLNPYFGRFYSSVKPAMKVMNWTLQAF